MLLLLGVLAGAGGYRLFADSPGYSEPSPVVVKTVRAFIRSGNRISVPEGSPLRAALTISPVAAKDIKRYLVLPAVVEANPAHLVKIAPPVSGRVTQLKVELGERVKAGQPLVVIDSPDLGTAYSDYDRAKVLLALALKTRTRETELAKIGGAALKDLQQAETDYVTARAEYQRAMAAAQYRSTVINAFQNVADTLHAIYSDALSVAKGRGLGTGGGEEPRYHPQAHEIGGYQLFGPSERAADLSGAAQRGTGRGRPVCRYRDLVPSPWRWLVEPLGCSAGTALIHRRYFPLKNVRNL